jgi:uncharacterized protein YcbX
MNSAIAALTVYPVKSCRGISLTTARITERGIEHDREWMIIDAGGTFLTQRREPRLAQIATALSTSALHLRAPGMSALDIPFDAAFAPVKVTVWRDTLWALDHGDAVATTLSNWIGQPVRLVRFDPAVRRECSPVFTGPDRAHVAFADGYPALIISEASLADLNARLSEPLPMNRFRPNIVLSGVEAYDEDHIAELTSGAVTLRLVKACARCQITTTDQATSAVGVEPLQTLATYRHDAKLEGVVFGMNAIVTAGAGTSVAVGDVAHCTFNF